MKGMNKKGLWSAALGKISVFIFSDLFFPFFPLSFFSSYVGLQHIGMVLSSRLSS